MAFEVAGIGNALVDALVVVEDDAILAELGVKRGMMQPVCHEVWMSAYEGLRLHHKIVFESGGSCANTISTAGLLGAKSILCGLVGDDQMGHMYAKKLEDACGSHALRFTKERATGKCLSIISAKDAERTMLTDLGAATELPHLGDFEQTLLETKWVHFEGYGLLGGPMCDTVLAAMGRAKAAGAKISFDASDPFVVTQVKDRVWSVIRDYADLVFLNSEEAKLLAEQPPEEAVHTIAREANIATLVVKLGGRGSLVLHRGELAEIPIRRVKAVDTTGAGDAYAGGFLYGMIQGWSPFQCGHLASAVAALTVSQIGAVVKERNTLEVVRDEFAGTV